jgi:hypothetical protein
MRDEQSLALFAFVRSHEADRYLFLPRLLSSGRAVKHFAEINRRNRLRVSDYLASTAFRVRGKLLCASIDSDSGGSQRELIFCAF